MTYIRDINKNDENRQYLDLESIKQSADLLAICGHDTELKRVASSGGGEYAGACPVCGGKDRFRVQPGAGRWLCRNCTGGKWDSVIGYIARRDTLDPSNFQDLQEICRRANGGELPTNTPTRQLIQQPSPAYAPPGKAWQQAAAAIIQASSEQLKQTPKALDYLHRRGLTEQTIKRFKLGYSTGGTIGGKYIPRGIVIPCVVNKTCWYIKIRLPANEGQKYTLIKDSKPAAIYNADYLGVGDYALALEGEFDCMIASQELDTNPNGLIACFTLGSATNTPDLATWGAYLISQTVIYSCYDNDQAGNQGAARLAELAGNRVQAVKIPGGHKDLNDYYLAGGNLREWLYSFVRA